MKGQPVLDRAISIVSAVLVPVSALLVHHGVISSQDAVDVGAVWVAAVGAFHGGTAVQRARTRAISGTAAPAADQPARPLDPTPEQLHPAGG